MGKILIRSVKTYFKILKYSDATLRITAMYTIYVFVDLSIESAICPTSL